MYYEVYPEYKTEYREEIDVANELFNTSYFSVKVLETTKSFHKNMVKYAPFVILICLQGDSKVCIRSTGIEVTIPEGNSYLIPAAVAEYEFFSLKECTKVFETFINNKKSIVRLIPDIFHIQ